jgi:hypothetical protein
LLGEIEPYVLTDEQKQAIRDCRFVYLTRDHSVAWFCSNSLETIIATGFYTQDRCGKRVASDPKSPMEYEASNGRPEVIQFVEGMKKLDKTSN